MFGFIIILLIVKIADVAFMAGGIYAMQNGYMKTGGFLIAGAILSFLFTYPKMSSSKKAADEKADEKKETGH
jgi:hypothetical protein